MRRIQSTVLIFLFLMLLPCAASAQLMGYNHPELNWRTIETEHFFFYFHQNMDRTPYIVAEGAESVF